MDVCQPTFHCGIWAGFDCEIWLIPSTSTRSCIATLGGSFDRRHFEAKLLEVMKLPGDRLGLTLRQIEQNE